MEEAKGGGESENKGADGSRRLRQGARRAARVRYDLEGDYDRCAPETGLRRLTSALLIGGIHDVGVTTTRENGARL